MEDLVGRSSITRHEAVDLSPVTGKIILVTGAAGSIGAELSRQLATYDPVKLLLLDHNESALHDLVTDLSAKYPEVDLVPALVDITVPDALTRVFGKYQPQVVFHAAAYKHVPMLEHYPCEALRVNVAGTRQLAELARYYHAERFVLISTDKAVNPCSVMGASKRLGELIIHAFSQQNDHTTLFTVVRFGNVLGSRGSVVPTFNRQIDCGGPDSHSPGHDTLFYEHSRSGKSGNSRRLFDRG
jgi:FlaA1/EpsC-like NDP-sugar epimerase